MKPPPPVEGGTFTHGPPQWMVVLLDALIVVAASAWAIALSLWWLK